MHLSCICQLGEAQNILDNISGNNRYFASKYHDFHILKYKHSMVCLELKNIWSSVYVIELPKKVSISPRWKHGIVVCMSVCPVRPTVRTVVPAVTVSLHQTCTHMHHHFSIAYHVLVRAAKVNLICWRSNVS